jgi:hypothetical protein
MTRDINITNDIQDPGLRHALRAHLQANMDGSGRVIVTRREAAEHGWYELHASMVTHGDTLVVLCDPRPTVRCP